MSLKLTRVSATLIAFGCVTAAFANVDPSKLVRVTNETSPKCVEYYNYNGDMFCSTTALDKEPLDPKLKEYETQRIIFDDRPWKLAWGKKSGDEVTVEYVPMGDNINNWHELVTSQFFPGLQDKATPKQFADKVIEGIQETGLHPIVKFIRETPDQVLFEFRVEKPANQIQDELQMITKGRDGMYALHYVVKEADMGAKKREEWVTNLSNSSLR